MSKQLKSAMYQEYEQHISGQNSLLFIDYARIPSEDVRALRNQMRAENLNMVVVKNSVFNKVLEAQGIHGFEKIAAGQTAVVFSTTPADESGAQRASKLLDQWMREKKSADIRGGVMEGQVSGGDEAKTWKDLPTREQQIGIVIGQILSAAGKLISQITGPGGKLASQIEKKGKEGSDE